VDDSRVRRPMTPAPHSNDDDPARAAFVDEVLRRLRVGNGDEGAEDAR